MSDTSKCELCGKPMPEGELMFKFHGYSGNCPIDPHGSVIATAINEMHSDPARIPSLENELLAVRAQLAERTADVNRLQTPYDEIMKEANKRWEELFAFHKGMINDKDSELDRLRADAERRLKMIQELIRLKDLKIEIARWNPDYVGGREEIADYAKNKPLIWEAVRREIKESTDKNNQSKEQESSNTKLGGESVGLDHRVTSPIQSESKT